MMSPSFAMSAFLIKDALTRRKVDFRQTKLRYFIVVLAIFVIFGCEYCFDNPSALQTIIQKNQNDKLSESEFNLLYSLYAFPNVLISLLGGSLIDSKGPRIMMILTAIICVLGQGIFVIGGFTNKWIAMLIGRCVFGIGGEVLHAAQYTLISRWFKASQLSVVLGICISFPKLGSSLNAIVSPSVAKMYQNPNVDNSWGYTNVGIPLLIGLGFMVLSLSLTFVLSYYDRKTQLQEKKKHQSIVFPNESSGKIKSVIPGQVKFIQQSNIIDGDKQIVQKGAEHLNFKMILKLPITYWILLCIAMFSEALFIPFLDNGNKYFLKVYLTISSQDQAGKYLILPYVVSSIMVIPLGVVADKIKNRGYLLIGSIGFYWLTYFVMMFIETNMSFRQSEILPWVPVFLLGFCIAIYCSIIVPTVPMVCPPQLLGTGFGFMQVLQNLALGGFPLIAGAIRQTQQSHLKGFHLQTLFFYWICCVCLSLAIFLEIVDRFKGNKLRAQDFKATYITKVMKEKI